MSKCPNCGASLTSIVVDGKEGLFCERCSFNTLTGNLGSTPSGHKTEDIGIDKTCPFCGHRKAVMLQIIHWRGDEDSVNCFRCLKCGKVFREGYQAD